MSLITWNDSFSVKVPQIDLQHKKLVKIINDLHGAMRAGKGKDVMAPIIAELVNYTKEHFTFEESLLKKHNYKELGAHVTEHKNFVAKITDFQSKYDEGDLNLSLAVMNFLSDWLVKHIKGTDKKYSELLSSLSS